MSDGGEESSGAETGGGEETRRGDQFLKENQPAAQVAAGRNYFSEEIEKKYEITDRMFVF